MQALQIRDGHLSYVPDYPRPVPGDDQALIRLGTAGICSTDLEIVRGYAGFEGILGHEFVGVVEAAEDTTWIGRRVVGGINLGCRACSVCEADGPEHCPKRTVLGIIDHDGAFADYFTLPIANLLPVPDDVPDDAAVFAEPLAAALRIQEQLLVRPSARTAVVGPGRLGMLIGQVLALSGTRVTMLGRRAESLALAVKLGIDAAIVGEQEDDAFDFVVEATGNEAGLAQALRIVRPLGTLVLKSTFAGRAHVDLTKLVVGEIRVQGSRCGPFEPALRLLSDGKIETRAMIDGSYSLSEGESAFEHASLPGVRKILLRP